VKGEMKVDSTSQNEKQRIEELFGRHINRSQIRYLKAAHLDVLESNRTGVGFSDAATGKRMFDCFTSAGSFNVSRHNPAVMQALEEAVSTLDMGTHHLSSAPKIALARRLSELAPDDLNGVLFAAGGGDAIDCAIKLARGATGRGQIIATIKAYHGHTGFALSANGKEYYRRYFEPLMPGFTFVPFNDLEAAARVISHKTAAFILEPVQGEAGIFPAEDSYLRGLRRLCDENGALLIFDEIQTAFGRTGKLFACEHSRVTPDIMTVAKSLSGALYPNAAVLYRDIPRLTDFVGAHPDFHETYSGGSDIACHVSLRVLDYLVEHRLWENAERMGARLRGALEELMQQQPKVIKAVRGLGLMIGIEYQHEFMGPMMADALARHGVFAVYSGNAPQVMRFMPPITINDEEMDAVIAAIRAAVRDMRRMLPFARAAARIPGMLNLLNNERVQIGLFGFLRRFERAAIPETPAGVLSKETESVRNSGELSKASPEFPGLDAYSSAGTFNLGRRPPELAAELVQAMRETDIGNFPMISKEKAFLARDLAAFCGGALECCVFGVMRGEPMEAACKIARGHTGRPRLVAAGNGWHGHTGFALSLSDIPGKSRYEPLMPDVHIVPFGDTDAALNAIDYRTAAFVIEPVQVENHCRVASAEYLHAVAKACRDHGTLLVVDETQTGFGRTGRKFAFEASGIQPDMVLLGEALGGGMFPITATVFTQEVNRFLNAHPLIHLSTFGGADVGCRVARKAVALYEREQPWRNAAAMGERLRQALLPLVNKENGPIQDLAGLGLVWSLDLGTVARANRFCQAASSAGLLVVPGKIARHTVPLRPSLLITVAELDSMIEILRKVAAQFGDKE